MGVIFGIPLLLHRENKSVAFLAPVRLRFSPGLERKKILDRDFRIALSVEEVVSKRARKIGPLDLRH
jgi:hypothetical protein